MSTTTEEVDSATPDYDPERYHEQLEDERDRLRLQIGVCFQKLCDLDGRGNTYAWMLRCLDKVKPEILRQPNGRRKKSGGKWDRPINAEAKSAHDVFGTAQNDVSAGSGRQ
jgi:hypothetical protein